MKFTKKFFLIWLFLIAYSTMLANQLSDSFQIIPKPKKVEVFSEMGLEFGGLKSIQLNGDIERPVLGDILSLLPEESKYSGGKLILKILDDDSIPESPEGYVLIIFKGNVEIASRGEAGLFYGCQTLEQLLEDAREQGIPIPASKITDYPDYVYRSVHFDVKHHLDHIGYYYESIDRLARYKINSITWEFEDKLGYQTQPLIGAPQAISIDEMAALTKYAAARNIEITPLVQGLGHATFILKHQEYAYLREQESNRWAFCPLNEGTYQVLFDLYREAIEATPGSKYFHIGGDEVGQIGLCDRCKPTADEKGKFELNLYWLNRVSEFLIEQGRIPIFWGDMPFQYAGVWKYTRKEEDAPELWEAALIKLDEVIDRFPKEGIFMHWNYSTCRQPGNDRVLEWLTGNNLNTMVSIAANSGPAALFPFDDRTGKMSDRGLVAIQSALQLGFKKGIDGVLSTGWDDRSPHMETYWRGFIATAEYSWNTEGRNLDEYQLAYMQREFGPEASYSDLYLQLRDAAFFWETSLVREGNRMETTNALLKLPGIHHEAFHNVKGEKYSDIILDMPDLNNPGVWTKKYKVRLDEAENQIAIYKSTSQQLDELYKVSYRNHYHWKLFSVLNDFQITAPKLLLALKESDVENKLEREEGIASVKKALDDFDLAWTELKAVYGETRYISSPKKYVADRYYHYASQREDLTWMIQVEKLLHELVRDWANKN
ncbi:MAG: beta-N-acetylhexosaminidase [Melioribacteraceae bacterium]|nr:beta-N-acetylhexosaminidase [Melioribacteraceae bacterium]